jgi:hypothetical protein
VPRRPCVFKQRDVTKALRAVAAAGMEIDRVEVGRDGKIVIFTAQSSESSDGAANEWDELYDGDQAPLRK